MADTSYERNAVKPKRGEHASQSSQMEHRRLPDWSMWLLGALAVITLLALCLVNGYRLEERNARQSQSRGQTAKLLRYGRPLSIQGLTTTHNRVLENDDFEGQWSLLLFVNPTCSPCSNELRALAKVYNKLKNQLHILPVLSGTPALISAERLASNYASRVGWPSEVAVDLNKEVSRECGYTGAVPYCVLLDPKRRVRFAMSGFEPRPLGSSKLADALTAFFTGETYRRSLLAQAKGKRDARFDMPITLQTGERTRLSQLSHDKTLVITFLNGDDSLLEEARVRTLRRFVDTPNVQFLLVDQVKNKPSSLMHVRNMPLLTQPSAAAISKAFEVKSCPTTLVVHKSRVLMEIGRGNNLDTWIEEELPYYFLLNGSNGQRNSKRARGGEKALKERAP